MTKILDASAILAWIHGQEPAAGYMKRLLVSQSEGKLDLAMSMINVGEVYYRLFRTKGEAFAQSFLREMSRVVRSIDVPNRLILEAAGIKGRHRISYADAFAVATSVREDAPLVTGDPELQVFRGSRTFQIEWIGKA